MQTHVFVYDRRPIATQGALELEKIRDATVRGTLFDVDGVGPALMLAGSSQVPGEVMRADTASLERLDARARVREGLFRRVGVQVGETPCWTWVAGPALAPRLAPERRVLADREDRS